jgi:hypothetical protein
MVLRPSLHVVRVAVVLLSATGVAADADETLAPAIGERLAQLPSDLRIAYFDRPHQAAPVQSPDGGAYQWFSGTLGDGAIYWSQYTGAHIIHEPFLEFFEESGHEQFLGYPATDAIAGPDANKVLGTCSHEETRFRQRFVIVRRDARTGRLMEYERWVCNSSLGTRDAIAGGCPISTPVDPMQPLLFCQW